MRRAKKYKLLCVRFATIRTGQPSRLHRLYTGGGNFFAFFSQQRLTSTWVDILFLALMIVFLLLTLVLVAACAALERRQ
jgi:hypothetical protein